MIHKMLRAFILASTILAGPAMAADVVMPAPHVNTATGAIDFPSGGPTGQWAGARMPAFTGGDCTTTAGSVVISCTKVNGVTPGTVLPANTGTSGHNIPFLDGVNTWSGNQTFTGALIGPYGTLPGTGTNGQIYATSGGFYAYYNGQWNGPFSTTGQNPTTPTVTAATSGTNVVYSTPAGVKWLEVTLIGGGGGGAGGGTAGGVAGNGGSSYWNTSSPASSSPIATAGGGTGGQGANYSGAGGGTVSGTCPGNTAGPSASGGGSSGGTGSISGSISGVGGVGGASTAGGGGQSSSGAGLPSGAGGGGGASGNGVSAVGGAGGGAGATCRFIVSSPVSTYYYTIGAGGTVGAAGTGGAAGGAGASGSITIVPHYNP